MISLELNQVGNPTNQVNYDPYLPTVTIPYHHVVLYGHFVSHKESGEAVIASDFKKETEEQKCRLSHGKETPISDQTQEKVTSLPLI